MAVSAAAFAASCGGGSDTQPAADGAGQPAAATSAGSFDPCALLTVEEVSAAVGWQPTTVVPSTQGDGMGTCAYGTGDNLAMPPQKVEVGVLKCPYNVPCYEDMPDFGSSQELVEYRMKAYEGAYAGAATVEPLDGLGMPAIHQDMLGLHSVEMYVARNRLAYVTTFTNAEVARALAEKVLARIR
jgi:hypothetical protein